MVTDMISSIFLTQYSIKNYTSPNPKDTSTPSFGPSLSSSSQNSDSFTLDYFSSKLGDTYTKSDVLLQLWQDAHSISLNDPNSFSGLCFAPTEQDLADLAHQMELHGLNEEIDFGKISNEFSEKFSTVNAGNLGDAIDELTSRLVALEGQIKQTGSEQMQQLNQLLEQGKSALIDSYANRLQSTLSLSDKDTQEVRTSLNDLIDQRIQTYRETQAQMQNTLSGTQDEWLLNQHQYMASQLRQATDGISDNMVGGELSLGDLCAAGEIAGAYQAIYQEVSQGKGGDEVFLALDLGMIDMKMETLIQQGAISDCMAGMLQNSLEQRHQNVMDAADQRLTIRRDQALSGDGPIPNLNRNLFQSIYDKVLYSFRHNGGDALSAIRDGVSFGKEAIAQVSQKNPNVSRWGESKNAYLDNFYTSIKTSDLYGNTRIKRSEYLKYADSWQRFLSTISKPNERFLSASSQEISLYEYSFLNTRA